MFPKPVFKGLTPRPYERLVGTNQKPQNDIVEIRGIRIDKTARRVYINGEERTFTTNHAGQHQIQNHQVILPFQSHGQTPVPGVADVHLKITQLQIILLQVCNCDISRMDREVCWK